MQVLQGNPAPALAKTDGVNDACPLLSLAKADVWCVCLQVLQSKPAPDIFLLALEQLIQRQDGRQAPIGAQRQQHQQQLQAHACLVFEDAPSGVEAGLAAGMQVRGRGGAVVEDAPSGAGGGLEDALRLGTCYHG